MLKISFTVLALGALISACAVQAQEAAPAPYAAPEVAVENVTVYHNETWGYSLNVPEELSAACDLRESEDGKTVTFALKESGDMVAAVEAISADEWKSRQGPWLGACYLGETETEVFYLQLPTCGTLNQESVRDTWEKLMAQAGELGPEDFVLLPIEPS